MKKHLVRLAILGIALVGVGLSTPASASGCYKTTCAVLVLQCQTGGGTPTYMYTSGYCQDDDGSYQSFGAIGCPGVFSAVVCTYRP